MYRNQRTGHEHNDLAVVHDASATGDVIEYNGAAFGIVGRVGQTLRLIVPA